jgi:hypothetical protein
MGEAQRDEGVVRHQRAIDLLGLAAHIADSNRVHAETYGPPDAAQGHAEALADYRGAIAVLQASAREQLECKKGNKKGGGK